MKLSVMPQLSLLVMTLLLNGCATQYGCKGMPDGPQCLSTTEAYQVTNQALPETPSHQDNPAEPQALPDQSIPVQQPVPKIDDPTPIRTPSQVMRIWIAPWEDADGDLMVSSYVYTELEPRRWMIGKAAPTLSPTLIPLQVEQRPPEKHQALDHDDGESRALPPGMTNKN